MSVWMVQLSTGVVVSLDDEHGDDWNPESAFGLVLRGTDELGRQTVVSGRYVVRVWRDEDVHGQVA